MSRSRARLATAPDRPVAHDPERRVVGIAPALVPLAAVCVAMLMVGALVVEGRQHRSAAGLALPTATLLLALLVAVGRAGPYHF
jgi:hypothetical protein